MLQGLISCKSSNTATDFTISVNLSVIGKFSSWSILGSKSIQKHPEIKKSLNENWHLGSRIACIFIWPIGIIIFLNSFFKQFFSK